MEYNKLFYSHGTPSKKIKIIRSIALIVSIIFFVIQTAKVIYQTPVFTGRILNSASGKPVKDAVVTAVWWKSSRKGLIPFYSVSSVTGEKGEYKIPKYTRIHGSRLFLLDPYFYMSFVVRHPLYNGIDLKSNLVWEEKNSQTGKMNFYGEKLPDGSINHDIVIDGLKEKYLLKFENEEKNKNEIKRMIKTWDPAGFLVHLGDYVNGWYWNVLKEQKVSYDISETFNKWEEIAVRLDIKNSTGSGGKSGGIYYSKKVYETRVKILTNLSFNK